MPSYERISTLNSSTTPLGAAAQFNTASAGEDVGGFATIAIYCRGDQNSAQDGFVMERSTDGASWTLIKAVTIEAGVEQDHLLTVTARFFRIRYTNGSTPQSEFFLQTIYHTNKANALRRPVRDVVTEDEDADFVRQVSDPNLDRNSGLIDYQETFTQYGRNPVVGTGAFEDIWGTGGPYNWLTAADTVRIQAGGNVADDAAGAGAQKVTIEGLDENWMEASETLATAGASVSASTTTRFIRIHKAFVPEDGAGTYTGDNASDVMIETTGGIEVACIMAGSGETHLGLYSVPAGKTAYLTNVRGFWDGKKNGTMRIYQRPAADDVIAPYSSRRLITEFTNFSGEQAITYASFPEFAEKTDIWASAIADTQAGAAGVSFDLCLVDN